MSDSQTYDRGERGYVAWIAAQMDLGTAIGGRHAPGGDDVPAVQGGARPHRRRASRSAASRAVTAGPVCHEPDAGAPLAGVPAWRDGDAHE